MKFNIIVADPPWEFSDRLTMSSTKRGSESQYSILSDKDIVNLNIKSVAADDAVLALWVPSSKLEIGLETMKSWGFDQKQTFIWVKCKKDPLCQIKKNIIYFIKNLNLIDRYALDEMTGIEREIEDAIISALDKFNLNDALGFFMGRLFRQTHEIALIGVRGKVYKKEEEVSKTSSWGLENKSQRSVLFDVNLKHSAKPEGLQNRLELMFPNSTFLELFARRQKAGWETVGLECPPLFEDIRDSIERLKKL